MGQPGNRSRYQATPVSHETTKLLQELKLHRPGLSFYALRHTFQTIGEKSRDKDAVRAIMGHTEAANDMSAVYNEEPVEDNRLRVVTDYVRAWLFPAESVLPASVKNRVGYGRDALAWLCSVRSSSS